MVRLCVLLTLLLGTLVRAGYEFVLPETSILAIPGKSSLIPYTLKEVGTNDEFAILTLRLSGTWGADVTTSFKYINRSTFTHTFNLAAGVYTGTLKLEDRSGTVLASIPAKVVSVVDIDTMIQSSNVDFGTALGMKIVSTTNIWDHMISYDAARNTLADELQVQGFTFQYFDGDIIRNNFKNLYDTVTTSSSEPPLTEEETVAAKQELQTMLNDNWNGHTFFTVLLAEELYSLADQHFIKGKVDAAETLMNKSLELMPDVPLHVRMCMIRLMYYKGILTIPSGDKAYSYNDIRSFKTNILAGQNLVLDYRQRFPSLAITDINVKSMYKMFSAGVFKRHDLLFGYDTYDSSLYDLMIQYADVQYGASNWKTRLSSWKVTPINITVTGINGLAITNAKVFVDNVSDDVLWYNSTNRADDLRSYDYSGVISTKLHSGHTYKIEVRVPIDNTKYLTLIANKFALSGSDTFDYLVTSTGITTSVKAGSTVNLTFRLDPTQATFLDRLATTTEFYDYTWYDTDIITVNNLPVQSTRASTFYYAPDGYTVTNPVRIAVRSFTPNGLAPDSVSLQYRTTSVTTWTSLATATIPLDGVYIFDQLTLPTGSLVIRAVATSQSATNANTSLNPDQEGSFGTWTDGQVLGVTVVSNRRPTPK